MISHLNMNGSAPCMQLSPRPRSADQLDELSSSSNPLICIQHTPYNDPVFPIPADRLGLAPYQAHPHISPNLSKTSLYTLVAPSKLVQCPNALLIPLLLCHPERLLVLHNVGQDGTAEEDHVFSARRIFDADLEVLLRQYESWASLLLAF